MESDKNVKCVTDDCYMKFILASLVMGPSDRNFALDLSGLGHAGPTNHILCSYPGSNFMVCMFDLRNNMFKINALKYIC